MAGFVRYYWIALIFISVFLTGCPSAQFQQGEVQRQWSESLRQLGIVPIFPPREDFFVGDVYAFAYDPESPEIRAIIQSNFKDLDDKERDLRLSVGINSRIHRIDFSTDLNAEYSNTISAPPTTDVYNSILNNPALAAIDGKIVTQTKELAALKKQLDDADKAVNDATEKQKNATRKKEDTVKAVTKATAELENAKKVKADTTSEMEQLEELKRKLRVAEDDVVKATRAVEDAGDDEEKKKAAKKELTEANRKKADLDTQITRLNEDITKKTAQVADVSTQQQALDDAKIKQSEAEEAVTEATRQKEDRESEKTKKTEELTPKIAAIEAKIEASKKVKVAIGEAGAKFLYPQPQFNDRNVYNGTPFAKDAEGKYIVNDRVNRLRIVGFPEFASTSISKGDLSALIPAEALALNVSASNVEKVVVKVPAAESYGTSFSDVYSKVIELAELDLGNGNKFSYYTIEDTLHKKLIPPALFQLGKVSEEVFNGLRIDDFSAGIKDIEVLKKIECVDGSKEIKKSKDKDMLECDDVFLYFRIVTEAYYARAIDVSLFGSESFGGLLEVAKTTELGSGDDEGEEDDTKTDEESPQFSGVIDSSAGGDTNDLLSAIKSNLGRTQVVPGGAIQMLNYSDKSIGLRRVYDRPIAIGFRGQTIKYNACMLKLKLTMNDSSNLNVCLGGIVDTQPSNSFTPMFNNVQPEMPQVEEATEVAPN